MKNWSFFGKIFSFFSKALLIFSGNVLPLQDVKEEIPSARTVDNDLQTLSIQEIMQQLGLDQLLQGLSVEKVAKLLDSMVPESRLQELVSYLIQDKQSPLGSSDKLELLFALAAASAKEAQRWPIFFDLIVKNADTFQEGAPLLFWLLKTEPSRKEYDSVVPLFIKWHEGYVSAHTGAAPDLMQDLLEKAVAYAVAQNDFLVFDQLIQLKPLKDAVLLNNLLWSVVEDKKDVRFIEALIILGADANFSNDGKHTLLMRATLSNNEPAIKQLLRHKADPEKVLDTAVGTAKQMAHDKNFVKLELLLDKEEK